jgi:antitoxin YefM
MTTLPLAAVRAQLSKLVEEATSTHERFDITRNGQRVAVLLGADDYDALRETIAVLSDSGFLQDHLAGLDALTADEGVNVDELKAMMTASGRRRPAE